MPQNALSRLKLCNVIHSLRSRNPRLRNPRTLHPAQLLRLVHEHMRAHGNILRIRTTIGQPKYFISNFEAPFGFIAHAVDYSRELDAERLGGMRGDGVLAKTLEEIHAVEAKGFDLYDGLRAGGGRFGDGGDVEVFDGALAIFDIYGLSKKIFQ